MLKLLDLATIRSSLRFEKRQFELEHNGLVAKRVNMILVNPFGVILVEMGQPRQLLLGGEDIRTRVISCTFSESHSVVVSTIDVTFAHSEVFMAVG